MDLYRINTISLPHLHASVLCYLLLTMFDREEKQHGIECTSYAAQATEKYPETRDRELAEENCKGASAWRTHTRMVRHRRIEIITLNIVPDMTEQEAVRVAAFMSPCEWSIPFFSPVSQYKKDWNKPLDERLQAALTDPSRISISSS